MTLTINAAVFEDSQLGAHVARSADGRAFSILFDALSAECGMHDPGARLARAEGVVQCEGRGWLSLCVRGALAATGAHGFAHVMVRANGRRVQACGTADGEPFETSLVVGADDRSRVRISLLLLAQRDLAESESAAGCWVDAIDLVALDRPQPAAARA